MTMIAHRKLAKLCEESYTKLTISEGSVEVLIERINGVQVLAFRGTQSAKTGGGWRDIWRDMRVAPSSSPGVGWGHSGFLKGALKALDGQLSDYIDKTKPVICTGHSLGGAMSQVVALALILKGYHVIEWVGFGSPRVFVGARNWRNTKMTNYRFGKDIVSTLLPAGVLYQHPVKPKHIGKAKKRWPNFKDHAIKSYRNYLNGFGRG